LRQAILDSGMSLRQVGFAAGVDPAAVIRFVNGDRSLTLPSADRLAIFLDLRLVRGRPRPARGQEEGRPEAGRAF
jgi:plasmid maintenance system antidote protein VapI